MEEEEEEDVTMDAPTDTTVSMGNVCLAKTKVAAHMDAVTDTTVGMGNVYLLDAVGMAGILRVLELTDL
jgi:hypothetical protein